MILIGLGANLQHPRFGPPRATLEAALTRLEEEGDIAVVRLSPWYESAAHPPSDQPCYVNAVAVLATSLEPEALLRRLHGVEAAFGRVRTVRNAARAIDLDLLAYDDRVVDGPGLTLPHPRMHERAFVLAPLADLDPEWRHPVRGAAVGTLIAALPPEQEARRLPE